MDKSYNDTIRPLLDLADRLTVLFKGTTIKIPRIASCGMQSHGKSSTLESITHISLPKGDGTVTICPIKISLRNTKEEEFARIKFELDPEEKYEKIGLEEIADKINEFQNKVKEENNVKEKEVKLFDRVIQVEVNRKNAPNLTLYDMPGLNFKKEIRKKSEEINEKFLKEKETTVLLVMSGSEEIHNCYVTEWMKKIPDYKKRFNAIITKAELLKNKKIEVYLDQIKSLNLENPPSLIVNKFGDYENLSYEEMKEKELELINQIPNINRYPNINLGMEKLIEQLIKLQKNDLYMTFSDIAFKVKKEIEKNEKTLKSLPSECESQEKFFELLEKCITKFKEKIQIKKEYVKCKENGQPEQNLLTLPFCEQVTNNINQFNSDRIPILEDIVPFNILLKPKIIEILSDFEYTIKDIYDYMINNINPIISESFGNFKSLEKKIIRLYQNYSEEQKKKMFDFYEEVYFLETENISTFNIEIINKVNTMNKHINYFLFGQNKAKKKKQLCISIFKKIKDSIPLKNLGPNNIDNNVEKNLDLEQNQKEKEDEQKNENEIETKTEKEEEPKTEDDKVSTSTRDLTQEDDKVSSSIRDLTKEVVENKKYGDLVKDKYQKYSELIQSIIGIIYNYEKEKNTRKFDHDEFVGRINIAYRPQEIGTFDEKLINEEFTKISEESENEFIPGFQYINKDKLEEFQELITKGEVQLKTANTITKMVSYLEIMLNRVLDMIFLSIQKYLYDRLTDDRMIYHIRNGIHLLSFEKCKKLVEIKPDLTRKRNECKDNIKNLKKALREIDNLKSENNIFLEEDDEEDDDEDEENKKNK